MGRKLNLSHLTEEECERIMNVLQQDLEVRQTEKDRIGSLKTSLDQERNKTHLLSQQNQFNKNCCMRCCQVFGLIFNRRRVCDGCAYNVCKNCCSQVPDSKKYICIVCAKEKELDKQSCTWFYDAAGNKFKRFGSAKVVRSLYKTSTSYCKLRHAMKQGGLKYRANSRFAIRNNNNGQNKDNIHDKTEEHSPTEPSETEKSDTELESGYTGSGRSRSFGRVSGKARPSLPKEFRDDREADGEDEAEDSDDARLELPSSSPTASSSRLPNSSSSSRSHGGSRPVSRAGSVDTLNLHSSPSTSSSPTSSALPSRKLRSLNPDLNSSSSSSSKPGGRSDSSKERLKWDHDSHQQGKIKRDPKDIYRHAFDSARKAEEHKFKDKFDVLLNDLHRTLDTQSPQGLTDSFASTSYGEVMLSFRGKVKDLLIGFSQRLQLAYESFEGRDSTEEHGQEVKQHVSRYLEDLLGESLDLTSDEAVSDLSSLSDDSTNDRHVFEDQIAQAVVSKILENHRKEVSLSLHEDQRRLGGHLSSPALVPEALKDDDEDEDRQSPTTDDVNVKDTDISKDFEDLKNFVEETQSRSRLYNGDSPDGGGGGLNEPGQGASVFDGTAGSRERDFPPLPDFSEFEQIDFNSGELDPDLLQMNLAVIPEETEEELEDDATDIHWRGNWIFKGQLPAAYDQNDRKRVRGGDDQPQYMMVPRPDDNLIPMVGNRDADELSDLSDNENFSDDDNSFYPRTSEELSRISKHKRSSGAPSFSSPSLIPTSSLNHNDEDDDDDVDGDDSSRDVLHSKRQTHPPARSRTSKNHRQDFDVGLDLEDVGVGTEDFVGPIVEPSPKELKLLEDLVPADEDDPKFVQMPESVTIQEGEPVKLSCRVSGTQPIDVFWYREHQEVEELEDSEDVELTVEGDRHQATLYNVGKQHAGQYMCIALSEEGKAIKYFTVTVKENKKQELKKPEFLKTLADVEVLEGQSVKFRCKVKGYPQPRINWYKDGNLLRSNKSCRIEKFGNRDYILTIDCATMDDDAEYTVMARNVAGEVKSTAQVIVEPYADNHPWLSKGRTHSVSTAYSDLESETSSARHSFTPRSQGSSSRHPPQSEDAKVDVLVSKVNRTRDNMRKEAEEMLVTAEELSTLSNRLDDMERDLDKLEGRTLPFSSPCPSHDLVDYSSLVEDEAAVLQTIEEEKETADAAKNVRKLTSNALSVLRAAEEIIESEKNGGTYSSPSSSLLPDNSAPYLSPAEENNNDTSVSLCPDLSQSQLTTHSDLNKSVSSGYGTISMTSSAMEDTENDLAGSLTSPTDLASPQDEFSLYLPPLEDDTVGSSYREEVSISLSSSSVGNRTNTGPSGSSSTSSSSATNSSSSSNASVRTIIPATSTTRNSTADALSSHAQLVPPNELKMGAGLEDDEPDSRMTMSDLTTSSPRAGEEDLVLNFGPKDINEAMYGRDYEVHHQPPDHPARQDSLEDGQHRKHWSVNLSPFSPNADVVNRKKSLEDTEEKIYLTAGKMFNLEDRVKDLESRVGAVDDASAQSLAELEDQVAKTAGHVARNEKHVSNVERTVNTLQFSPRSSRGSNSSTTSTPRESIDSGVSSFTPERQHERPLPVHLVGQTQEEEMPESRAEYDADSGIELPSVSRLRAMFGANRKDDEGEGYFKRVNSITARSLTKDQLQKLRAAGNTTGSTTDIVRLKDSPAQSSRATVQLRTKADGAPGAPQSNRHSYPQGPETASSTAVLNLTPARDPSSQEKGAARQIRAANLPEPARYQQLDPSKEPVLIYPEVDAERGDSAASSSPPRGSSHVSRSRVSPTPRPRSAVFGSDDSPTQQGGSDAARAKSPIACRPRAQSVSDASETHASNPTPKIRSGCISARAAFWERRIMQGEATDTNVEEEFPEMVQDNET